MNFNEIVVIASLIGLYFTAWRDSKTMLVNSILNYGIGLLVAFAFLASYGAFAFLAVMLFVFAFNHLSKESFAEGDQEIFYYLFPSLLLAHPDVLVGFPLFVILLTLVLGLIAWIKSEKPEIGKIPGTPLIFACYGIVLLISYGFMRI